MSDKENIEERKESKGKGTQTSFDEDQAEEYRNEDSTGNIWTNVPLYSESSSQTSVSGNFAEICDEVLSLTEAGRDSPDSRSETKSDSSVDDISSALGNLDTKHEETSGEISK